ncbi:hypothetical protein C0J52_11094 [Blattella germanica]|nr:hypothetical protein C0J52_11094 [Blattella germanica]
MHTNSTTSIYSEFRNCISFEGLTSLQRRRRLLQNAYHISVMSTWNTSMSGGTVICLFLPRSLQLPWRVL